MKLIKLNKSIQIVLLFCALLCSVTAYAQTSVKGKVTSESESLPGVSVLIKGTQIGTTTDIDGNYTLQAETGTVLQFVSIGYEAQEVTVSRSIINVTLKPSVQALNEVVVTALGIKREKKALGYAVQELKGSSLTEVRDPNMLNALSGQVAGVQISNVSTGGIGGSPKVVIRGESSLSNNDPLFIIDGIPISNNKSDLNTNGVDFGNGAADINPDDVESITVLKGPTAAALYGSRAGNGAIVITTKTGKKNQGLGISFNSNITVQPWLLRTPDYQYIYGGGENFQADYIDGVGGNGYSFGPKLNQPDPNTASGLVEIVQFNSPIDPVTGKRIPTPWVSHPNFLEDFFETGTIVTNNLSVSNSNDKGSYRFSYTNMDQKGIVPNTDLKRNTFALSASSNIAKNLTINTNANYVINQSDNMPQTNYWDQPIMYSFLWWGMNDDPNSLKKYWKTGREGLQQDNVSKWSDNPYFTLYENTQSQLKNRVFGNININYGIIDGLSLIGRIGVDWYTEQIQIKRAVSSVRFQDGNYSVNSNFFSETNADFLLTWDKPIEGDIQYKVSLGGNRMQRSAAYLATSATELSIPGLYNLGNSKSTPTVAEDNQKKEVQSIYAMGQISYKNLLFMDLTARNDWSSTLPSSHNSFFYPSISVSGIVSDMVDLPKWISFAKLRSSYAIVGNDTDPYQLRQTFSFAGKWGSTSAAREDDNLVNANLKPEKINSIEGGLDLRFLQNRIGIDISIYNTTAINQILRMPLAISTGYGSRLINAGKIESKGLEIVFNATPVKTANFNWNVTLNWSTNKSYVRELVDGIPNYEMGGNAQARVGERMGDMYGWGFKHAPDGQMIHDGGLPVWEDEIKKYGNYNPDWMAGLRNVFTFKRIGFSALFDYRKGGIIYSNTLTKGMEGGVLAESAIGDQRENGLVSPGVMYDANGAFTPNTVNIGHRNWINHVYNRSAFESGLYDASYIKLREMSLSYTIPSIQLTSNYSLRNVSFSLVGRNLWLWSKAKHIDPESGGLGVENNQIPTPKSFGFNLSVSF